MESCESLPKFIDVKHPITGRSILISPRYDQSIIDSAAKYRANESDIFVCSFPKSGSTWTQNIVWLIVHKGESFQGFMDDCIPCLEFKGSEVVENIDNSVHPRIIKTHLPYDTRPRNPKAKYIYVCRNPKDTLVSYYFHLKGFTESYKCPNVTISDVFRLYIAGNVEFNSYFDHAAEWYSNRNQNNVLFLLYEDMKKDLRSNVLKIARFLGGKYEKQLLENNGEVLSKVVEQSSFKVMQKDHSKWINSKRIKNLPFIRRGEVGDWKNHLSPDQAATMDQLLRDKGKESGIDQLWDDYPDVDVRK